VTFGIVVIGRNEGERLRRCLESIRNHAAVCVYVDSGSTDGSCATAHSFGVRLHKLDCAKPFNASRARQEGFEVLLAAVPSIQYVFFVDGDCEVCPDWLSKGVAELAAHPDVAVVCGRRRERYPEHSVFNRLCDMEWNTPLGEAKSCGGDSIMRVDAYRQVGGFDISVTAGEEPELCQRLRSANWRILRIDVEMTLHDADITRIGQWWRRARRTGYGAYDVQQRLGVTAFKNLNRSTLRWVIGWPVAVVILGVLVGVFVGAEAGLAMALLVALLLPVQMLRVAWRGYRRGLSAGDAAAYGVLTMLDKWPQWQGMRLCQRDIHNGSHTTNHDYKSFTTSRDSNWIEDLKRYPKRPFLKEQSIWAIWVYRWGRRIDRREPGTVRELLLKIYWLLFRLAETVTGISLPKSAHIGPGLRIHHFGNIFINPAARIGANCTLRQGVTIGNRIEDGPVPTIGDNVDFGAYAQVLGGVHIGNNCRIGAMSVVLCDVPDGCTAVGVPARVMERQSET